MEESPTEERAFTELAQRAGETTFRSVDDRTFEFSFSSEFPVDRSFGQEVLSHDSGAMDASRLNGSAPLLFNHDMDRVIGVVERGYTDEKKKRGVARVRFSQNNFAQEVLNDVRDGILNSVSVGYRINEMEERGDQFVATNWSPYEISVVASPADTTVGFGRSLVDETTMSAGRAIAQPAAQVAPQNHANAMTTTPEDLEVVRAEAEKSALSKERARVAAIRKLCAEHNLPDLGDRAEESGMQIEEVRQYALKELAQKPVETVTNTVEIGLSEKETRQFSFARAINYLANPNDRGAREAAAFEIEASEAAAQKLGRQSRGITIPVDVMRRDLTVGTNTAGGNLVSTDLDAGSFIDLLRNQSILDQAGATVLTGLTGNVAIPRQSGAATAYWVAESGSPTESAQTIDQVQMSPKTCGAFTDYSRRLFIQSSIDVENMIRTDLARVIALEIDRVGLYGTGGNSQPLGLKLTNGIGTEDFSANTPTFAECVALETDVSGSNALAGAPVYLMNSAMRGGLKTATKDSGSGQFVMEGGEVNGYRAIVSEQVESNDLWFGNFSDLVIGYFSGLDLQVDPYTGSTSGTVRVIALQDVDIAVRHAASFSRGNNTL